MVSALHLCLKISEVLNIARLASLSWSNYFQLASKNIQLFMHICNYLHDIFDKEINISG